VHGALLTFRRENETDVEMPVPTLNPYSLTTGRLRGSCKTTYHKTAMCIARLQNLIAINRTIKVFK